MASVVSGAAFGAAMMAAGFRDHSVVIAQMKLDNWHIFQAFLTATASSACESPPWLSPWLPWLVTDCRKRHLHRRRAPGLRPAPVLELLPARALRQVRRKHRRWRHARGRHGPLRVLPRHPLRAARRRSLHGAVYSFQGAVVGGIVRAGALGKLVQRRRDQTGVKPEPVTVSEQLGLSRAATLLLFEAACLAVVASTTAYTPRNPRANLLGIGAGLLIGLAQLVSIATRRSMVGVSGSYEKAVNIF